MDSYLIGFSGEDLPRLCTPHVGNTAKILKHGYCFHIGEVGEITEVRYTKSTGLPEAIRVTFKGAFNTRRYWLPILRGELQTGKFKYFELYPF